MKGYSYTKIKDYTTCPFFYNCKHNKKTPIEVDTFTKGGRAAHGIICAYTEACYKDSMTSKYEEWEKIAKPFMSKHKLNQEETDNTHEVISNFVSSTEIQLEGLAGVEKQFALDKKLEPCSWKKGWIRSKIDKLYLDAENCLVSDYKTGYRMTADKFQVNFYLWMMSKHFSHITRFQGEFDFVRFQFQKRWEVPKEDIKKIEKQILGYIDQIEQDKIFKPKIQSLCKTCPYWKLCPAIKQKQILRTPKNTKDAIKILEQILVREKDLLEYKQALKGYVEEKGSIAVNDMIANIKSIAQFNWDLDNIVIWAKKNKKSISDLIKVDSEKMKEALREIHGEGIYPKKVVEIEYQIRFEINKIKKRHAL